MTDIKWHQEERPKMRVNTREGVTYLTCLLYTSDAADD